MTWYAVFAAGQTGATAAPISTGEVINEADLTSRGLTFITLAGDPSGMIWSTESQSFVAPPATAIPISRVDFMALFTLQERIALRTSTDPVVQDFIWHVNNAESIDLTNPLVTNGLEYISSNPTGAPILASGRSATILAGTPSGS